MAEGQGHKLVHSYSCHAAQHDEFALGKVNDACGVVNDVEAYGNDSVDRAVGQARNQILKKKFNVHILYSAAMSAQRSAGKGE